MKNDGPCNNNIVLDDLHSVRLKMEMGRIQITGGIG